MLALLDRVLPLLPVPVAAGVIRRVAFHPYRYRTKPEEQQVRATGRGFQYGAGLRAWSWGDAGPVVVLVHGWGGASVQGRRFIPPLVDAGYRVVAPDIAGHGLSPGRRIGFDLFAAGLAELRDALAPGVIHAFVGHSAGGLGMMAARYLHGLEARKFVCIATPSHPYPPVKVVGKKIRMPAAVVARFRESLARQFRSDWDDITARAFLPSQGSELLLINDPRDRYLDDDDVPRILAHWPHAKLHLAAGVGHENLIRADECIAALLEFLRA